MCVSLCVYICMRVHICVSLSLCVHICVFMYTYVCTYIWTSPCIHLCVCVYVCVCVVHICEGLRYSVTLCFFPQDRISSCDSHPPVSTLSSPSAGLMGVGGRPTCFFTFNVDNGDGNSSPHTLQQALLLTEPVHQPQALGFWNHWTFRAICYCMYNLAYLWECAAKDINVPSGPSRLLSQSRLGRKIVLLSVVTDQLNSPKKKVSTQSR